MIPHNHRTNARTINQKPTVSTVAILWNPSL